MADLHRKKPEPEREQERKARRCLMCGAAFQSEWAGERVCPRCKQTAAWRQGVA